MARDDADDRIRRKRPVEDIEEERPRKKRPIEEFEEGPPRKRRAVDDEDERPRKRRPVDEDEDDRPRKRRRDDEDDDYDRPRKKKKKGGGKGLLIGLIVGGSVLLIGLVVVLIIVLSGGDSHERVMRDMIKLMNRASDVLEAVKDEASAKSAIGKLKELGTEAQGLKKRADALGKPSPEEEKRLMTAVGGELMVAFGRAMKAQMSAQRYAQNDPAFREALQELNKMK
jgi:hypothetical protein